MDNFGNTCSENRYIKLDCYLWLHLFHSFSCLLIYFHKKEVVSGTNGVQRDQLLCGFSTKSFFFFFLGKECPLFKILYFNSVPSRKMNFQS